LSIDFYWFLLFFKFTAPFQSLLLWIDTFYRPSQRLRAPVCSPACPLKVQQIVVQLTRLRRQNSSVVLAHAAQQLVAAQTYRRLVVAKLLMSFAPLYGF
jgi:hypothetical protein